MVRRDFSATFYVDHLIKDLGLCVSENGYFLTWLGSCSTPPSLAQPWSRCSGQPISYALERLNNISIGSAQHCDEFTGLNYRLCIFLLLLFQQALFTDLNASDSLDQ
ncbi:hypothetical protein L6164_007907 [Bauhinia variegata]|uniref:Uncharacterized protein n=1 Tax=Bauhinia variegata TaxID=167791 RepID=A0ACB9PF16_BAUVA|nr:hypothetical protein L6164_007907 [Bauhinia variegata]